MVRTAPAARFSSDRLIKRNAERHWMIEVPLNLIEGVGCSNLQY
jgi:hypothetical protein